MAATKTAPRKKAVKKVVIPPLTVLLRCDESESELVRNIMKLTDQKAATKAIIRVLREYQDLKTDLATALAEGRDLKNKLRTSSEMGLQFRKCIEYFSKLEPTSGVRNVYDDDDDDDEDWDDDDNQDDQD